jgi:hypothetical protein
VIAVLRYAFNRGHPSMRSILLIAMLLLTSLLSAAEPGVLTISATDAIANEPTSTGRFTISRTGDLSALLTVNVQSSGTATSAVDYAAIATAITIPAGASSVNVTVTPIDDDVPESLETIVLTILPGQYTLGASTSSTVVLHDDERPTLSIAVTPTTFTEAQPATFTVMRAGKTNDTLTVKYSVTGTALNGTDYALLSGAVIIPANSPFVGVPLIVTDDSAAEFNETVTLTLTEDPAYNLTSVKAATTTILDNEVPVVSLKIADAAASEPGLDTGRVTLSRVGNTKAALTVNLAVSGSATNGDDYEPISTTAIIPANASSLSIYVRPFDDSTFEPAETVVLSLWHRRGAGMMRRSRSRALAARLKQSR